MESATSCMMIGAVTKLTNKQPWKGHQLQYTRPKIVFYIFLGEGEQILCFGLP